MQSIRLIPSKSARGNQGVLLEIQRSRTPPFGLPDVVRVSPADVTLSEYMWKGENVQAEREIAKKRLVEGRNQALHRKDALNVSLLYRRVMYWLGVGWTGVSRIFINSHVLHLRVKGHSLAWKIDARLAWALREGEALDELVKNEEVD